MREALRMTKGEREMLRVGGGREDPFPLGIAETSFCGDGLSILMAVAVLPLCTWRHRHRHATYHFRFGMTFSPNALMNCSCSVFTL